MGKGEGEVEEVGGRVGDVVEVEIVVVLTVAVVAHRL